MKRVSSWPVVLCAMLLVVSCGKTKEIKKAPPMPLPKVTQSIAVQKIWSVDVGSGAGQFGVGLIPALLDGRLYAGDATGQVTVLDARTGNQLWQSQVGEKVTGAIGVGDGIAVVGTPKGEVLALNVNDGKTVWRRRVASEVLAPATIGDGKVVVRSVDGSMTALAAADGERKWSLRRPVPGLSLRGSGAPLITQGLVIAGFADGKIVAVDLEKGTVRWDTQVAYPHGRNEVERMVDIDGRPLLVGTVLYVASYQGRVMAMALGSRRVVWARDLSSYADLGSDSTNLYVVDEQGNVIAIDRLTGTTLWQQDKLQRRGLTGPLAVGDYVVVGDFEGYLHFLEKSSGNFMGQYRVGGNPLAIIGVIDSNTFYVLAQDGGLTSLTLKN